MQERERLDELRARARYEELRAKAGQSAATPQERGAQMGEYYGRGLGQMADRLPFGIGNAMDSLPRSVNLSDEMVGGAANMSTRVSNLVNRQDVDPNAAGQAAADQWRGRVQAYRDEKPVQSFVQEAAAGGAAAMLGGAGLAANAPRVAQGLSGFARSSPITTGALAGAAGGGVAGAGAGETGADRRFGALAGAGAGAVLGGAIPLAAPLVGRGANAVMRRMGRDVDDMPESMRKFFASVPDEVRNQTAENVGEAGPEFLGERLGARGEGIMTALAQRPEPSGDFARAAARRRAEQRTGRVMAEVQMRTGSRRGVNAIADRMEAEARAKPMFNAAAAQPVEVSGQLRAAVREADRLGLNVGSVDAPGETSLSAFLSDQTQDGPVTLGRLHQFAQEIEDEAGELFRKGRGNRGERVAALGRDLRRQLREASPEFAEASGIWRSAKNDERAFQIGTRVFDEGRDRASIEYELRNFVGGMDDMSASERGQFLSGVLDAIERRASSAAQGGNAGSRLTRQGVQERLSIVFGDESDVLADTLSREGYTASLDRLYDPNIGSPSAPRLNSAGLDDQALRGGGSRFAADVVQDVRGGTIGKGRTAIANRIRGASPQERERLAQLMFMESNPDANAMLNQMIDEQRRRAGLIGSAGAYGGYTAGSSNQR